MITSDGNLQINITANTSQAQASIANFNKQLSKATSSTVAPGMSQNINQVTKGFQNLGNVVGGIGKKLKNAGEEFKNFSEHVWTARGNLKDFTRVATGILMAQFFYQGIVQPIKNAITALYTFNSELERMQIAYKYMLGGSAQLANDMLKSMQKLAATTPYTLMQIADMGKMLMRYGFEAKQIMPVSQILIDTASAYGMNAEQIQRLTMALGQMMGKGKLIGQEKKQLAELIPLYKILQEQLGMSGEDIQNKAIPAQDAIKAILSWMQKQHKGVASEMEQTVTGMMSSIKDFATFLGQDVLAGFWKKYKDVLKTIRDTLARLWDAFDKRGFQGLFTAIFPPNMVQTAVILYNSIIAINKAIFQLVKAFGPAIGIISEFGARMLTYVLPPLTWLIAKISEMIQVLLRANSAIKVLVGILGTLAIAVVIAGFIGMLSKAITVLGIAAGVSKAVNLLSLSFTGLWAVLAKNPWVALATIIAGAIVYIAMTSEWGARMIDKLQRKIAEFFGIKAQIDAVTASTEASSSAFEDYSGEIENFFDGISESAGDANDEVKKFLASFDEVYNIPDPTTALGGIGNVKFEIPQETRDWFKELESRDPPFLWITDPKPIDWEKILGLSSLLWIIIKAWDTIVQWFKDLWKRIKDWWNDKKLDFTDFWKGLQLEWQLAWEAVKLAVLKAIASAKAWGITIPVLLGIPVAVAIDEFLKKLDEALGRSISLAPAPLVPALAYIQRMIQAMITSLAMGDFKGFVLAFAAAMWAAFVRVPAAILSMVGVAIKGWFVQAFKDVGEWLRNTNDNPYLQILAIALTAALAFVIMGPSAISIAGAAIQAVLQKAAEKAAAGAGQAGLATANSFVYGNSPDGLLYGITNAEKAITNTIAGTVINSISSAITNVVKSATNFGKAIIGGIISGISSMMSILRSVLQGIFNSISTAINSIFNTRPTVTYTKSYGATGLHAVPGLAEGGIVNKSQIARIGEGGRPEMVAPLSETSLAPFANMIAGLINNSNRMGSSDSDYVAVRMKKSDLVNLERALFVIRKDESARVSGRKM